MKTVVYQSYRTTNVPPWIGRCMETVRSWASMEGFDYHFIDDHMFTYAPKWYRQRVADNVCLVSDLARLLIAKELLAERYERAIWVDADVVIINPDQFSIPITREFAFCLEVWVTLGADGQIVARPSVNNAVSVFVRGNSVLDFYILACQAIIRNRVVIDRLDVGTTFLGRLYSFVPLPLLDNVGMISPLLMDGLVRKNEAAPKAFASMFRTPVRAANLCSSFRGRVYDGVTVNDVLLEGVIDELLRTRGGAINRWLEG